MKEFNDTDRKIMNATFEILQKEGLSKATTKKIAAKAGVNEVTIFRKFENKKNLVEITKEYYFNIFLQKLDDIFDFNEDDEIEGYLQSNFIVLLNLSEEDFSIIKIAMEEVREIPERKQLMSRISTTAFDKLEQFFKFQIEQGKIRDVDTRVLAVMCYSMTFHSVVLYKIYDGNPNIERDRYAESFLDIFYNGIKA